MKTPDQDQKDGPSTRLVAAAFASLGFCIGLLTAMSASPVAPSVVVALFTFSGGGALLASKSLPAADKALLCKGILTLSLGTVLGIGAGITICAYLPFGSPFKATDAADSTQPTASQSRPTSASGESPPARRFLLRHQPGEAILLTLDRWRRNETTSMDQLKQQIVEDLSDSLNDALSTQQVESLLREYQRNPDLRVETLLDVLGLSP